MNEPAGLAAVDIRDAVVIFLVEVKHLGFVVALELQSLFQNLAIASKIRVLAGFSPAEDLSVRHVEVDDVAWHDSALGHQAGLRSGLWEVLKDPALLAAVTALEPLA